jgi:hypothetical protein
LGKLACRELGIFGGQVVQRHISALDFGAVNATTQGLYRCSVVVQSAGRRVPWSCVLKVLRAPPSEATRSGSFWNYWQREACFYTSGLPELLKHGLASPRCYAVTRPAARIRCLWLEDVGAHSNTRWALADHLRAANHLGRFGGSFATGPLPTSGWLSRRWLRQLLAGIPGWSKILKDPKTWSHPAVKAAFPQTVALRALYTLELAPVFVAAIDRLPQTLCHLDPYRPNLFRSPQDGEDRTVAIDWAFVGIGAVGVDLGQMLAGNLMWLEVATEGRAAYEQKAFNQYLKGLRQAGWRGRTSAVRLAHTASAALRIGFYLCELLRMLSDPGGRALWESKFRRTQEESLAPFGRAVTFLLGLADEARSLLPHAG